MKFKDFININEVLLIAIGIILLFPLFSRAQSLSNPPSYYGQFVKQAVTDPTSQLGSEANYQYFMHTAMMKKLYSLRNYEPIWIDGSTGRLTPMATELRRMLLTAYRHGLPAGIEQIQVNENGNMVQKTTYVSRGYWDRNLEGYLSSTTVSNKDAVYFELFATEAFLRYVQHIFVGRFDPRKVDDKIDLGPRTMNDNTFVALNYSVNHGDQFAQLMDRFAPESGIYKNMMTLLNYFRRVRIAGGWPVIPAPGTNLTPGVSSPVIPEIRKRFKLFGYQINDTTSNVYDAEFGKVLRRFQQLNNLDVDGVIGGTTSKVLRYLNVPVDTRVDQLVVNMERLRWLPHNMGERYVFVNLAMTEFHLHDSSLSPDELARMQFRTINGKDVRQTPLMIDEIRYINFNPTWTVPSSIVLKDKLPILRKNPAYLSSHNMVLLQGKTVVDPLTVPWATLSDDDFVRQYTIMQKPGYNNALGVVKFPLVKNTKAIYMHDTNERDLFASSNRHGSSGCIRLQYPLEFAAYLLADQNISLDEIKSWVPDHEMGPADRMYDTFSKSLKKPIAVYIQYLTTEVGSQGEIRFADDVYGQDDRLKAALNDPKNNGDF